MPAISDTSPWLVPTKAGTVRSSTMSAVWRDRPGHKDGGRYGSRGGSSNSKWHTEMHRAKAKGKHYLEVFLAENKKPQEGL